MLGENRDPLHRYRHWVAYLNWIFGSSGGSEAVVALGALVLGSSGGLREQWWLLGAVVDLGALCLRSSGGSLLVTTDCENAVLGTNLAISLEDSGLPVLRWAGIWDDTAL
jgi:hypothetical protein